MIITLGDAREAVAKFAGKAGKCASSDEVRLFVLEIVQNLLFKGAHGNLRKWSFCLCNGVFTAPADLETPLRVKLGGRAERVWSYWYEFYDADPNDINSRSFVPGLVEENGNFFTVYDLPPGGGRLAALPMFDEDCDAHIIVQGTSNGREVFTKYKGETFHGERIPISRNIGSSSFSKTRFDRITGIEKSLTNSHVRLYWQDKAMMRGLLGEYRPTDRHPSFRRFRVTSLSGPQSQCCMKVDILGRIRMLESYHNNDILPIASLPALKKQAAILQAEENKEFQNANYLEQRLDISIEDENRYKKTGQEPFDFFLPRSPGSNVNLQ